MQMWREKAWESLSNMAMSMSRDAMSVYMRWGGGIPTKLKGYFSRDKPTEAPGKNDDY